MIKQNKLVPKRRFEEFEKEWRKSKFLEIVFRLSEKSKEDIPRVEFEDINSGLGTLNKDIIKRKVKK
ncbi:hypothetical protein [Jeotgalicoccus sp. WY2]|uniref:hypothetical protein n=1 Tax=Jeotgalicoccus sp. WY2 TaxID=2708346 RepID=UPI001BD32058|nr:hypothetical protein [Jeotgalicoccus sp. WY2]